MNPQISKPTLLLDEERVRNNLQAMADKARAHGLRLKPHLKTHQSLTVARWARECGTDAITVSSVAMARYFAAEGWDDITIAFPCYPAMARAIRQLPADTLVSVLISEAESAAGVLSELPGETQVYLEIDTGSGRTGFRPGNSGPISRTIRLIRSSGHRFRGFYSHPGHSYQCSNPQEICTVHAHAVAAMRHLRAEYAPESGPIEVCLGDTPCCSVAEDFEGVTEISPGNYVFYDLMQHAIGSCGLQDIGVALAGPVAARYPERNEIAVHAGAVHLSKEQLAQNSGAHYGRVVALDHDLQWDPSAALGIVRSLSQEHGIVQCSEASFGRLAAADAVAILPVHSCLTAQCMGAYRAVPSGAPADHFRSSHHPTS